jgi:hypothetical protein
MKRLLLLLSALALALAACGPVPEAPTIQPGGDPLGQVLSVQSMA